MGEDQHLTRKRIALAIIGAIAGIAYGMNYANTFHEFTTWTASLLPDEISRFAYRLLMDFLLQPIRIAGYSFPLALALSGAAIAGGAVMRKRHRGKWEL